MKSDDILSIILLHRISLNTRPIQNNSRSCPSDVLLKRYQIEYTSRLRHLKECQRASHFLMIWFDNTVLKNI